MLTKKDIEQIEQIIGKNIQALLKDIVDLFNTTNERIDKVDLKLSKRIDQVDEKLSKRIDKMELKLDNALDHLKDHHNIITIQEKRINSLEEKVFVTTAT